MTLEKKVQSQPGPLERLGHVILKRMGKTCPQGVDLAKQRILTDAEQVQLKGIARAAVFRAGLAGAISAVIAAAAAVYAEQSFPETLQYWLVFGSISLMAAALEVGFLYFDALRTAHRISSVCDVELFPESEERSRMAGIMVRAAMELPNPPDRDPYIDPFRKASKLRILIGVLLYKGKVLVTNALAKVLVRKLLLRGVARAWLEFVAVPVTAAWNALVCFWVLRQVRVRAIGPSSVLETLPKLLGGADELVAETSQRAVACCVSASRDLHPNHLYMLEWMRENNGFHVSANIDDDEVFFSCFEALNEESKKVVIEVLAMAVIIDGRVAGREKKFFTSVLGRGPASNEVMSIKQLDTMAHEFRNGKGVVPFLESERS